MEGNEAPFSAEELDHFFESDQPVVEEAKPTVSSGEFQQLLDRQQYQHQRDTDLLREQLSMTNNYIAHLATPQTPPPEKQKIPIEFDEKGYPFVDPTTVEDLAEAKADEKFKSRMQHLAPALANVQQQQALQSAIAHIQQAAPELLEGRDPNDVAKLAIDTYNSSFLHSRDPHQRTSESLDRVRQILGSAPLPKSTGSGLTNGGTVQAYNQTGRTPTNNPGGNPFGFAKGAKINVKAQSINELGGLDKYEEYAARVNAMQEYNQQNNMGWTFNY